MMPPAGPPRVSQSSIRTSQPTPIIEPNPKVKYSIVLRLPCSLGIGARTIAAPGADSPPLFSVFVVPLYFPFAPSCSSLVNSS